MDVYTDQAVNGHVVSVVAISHMFLLLQTALSPFAPNFSWLIQKFT